MNAYWRGPIRQQDQQPGDISNPAILAWIEPEGLAQDVMGRLPWPGGKGACLKQMIQDKPIGHRIYTDKHGEDLPGISNWKWGVPQ